MRKAVFALLFATTLLAACGPQPPSSTPVDYPTALPPEEDISVYPAVETNYVVKVSCPSKAGSSWYYTANAPDCITMDGGVSCSSLGGPGFYRGGGAFQDSSLQGNCSVEVMNEKNVWVLTDSYIGRYYYHKVNKEEFDRFLSFMQK